VYPPMAKQARIQGVVRLEAHIGRDGRVLNLKVISGHPLLSPAAIDAVKQWEYKPMVLNGEAVEVFTTVDVNFTLGLAPEAVRVKEQSLRANPEDLEARLTLLEHYTATIRNGAGASLIEARRGHVLWLIEHHPEAGLLSAAEGMLFPAGYKLADPVGYEQAKSLWLGLSARSSDQAVLRHAALFLLIREKELAETLLLNAQAMQPTVEEWPDLLGKLYAQAILGLSIDPAGGAMFVPQENQSALAYRGRTALDSSPNLIVLRSADAIFTRYGAEQMAADQQLEALVSRIKARIPLPQRLYRVELPK